MNVMVISGVVLFCLTAVSVGASYSTYLTSFQDWPTPMARLFAMLTTVGIEIAFCLLIYAMLKAYVGGEIPVAGFGAAVLLVVMACNFIVHAKVATHQPLEDWQVEYQNWIGKVVPFFTIAMFVVLSWISPEGRERRQLRKMQFIGKEKALDYQEEYLNSNELIAELENTQPWIADSVRDHIRKSLPPAPIGTRTQTAQSKTIRGFDDTDHQPDGRSKAMDYMRQKFFGDKDQSK